MNNGFLITENPFFKRGIDKLCLICNHQFQMDQIPHSLLDMLEQTQLEPQMNVYDALESISNEIKLQKDAEKVCELCYKNISRVIRFCDMCNKSASFLKSYIQYQEMNNISLNGITNPVTHGDRPMLTELTGANVLSIIPELLNDHKQQDVQIQVWPECAPISTLVTLSSTTETILEKNEEEIVNMEALAKVVCTKPKIVNDVVEQNVKMELWPELGTIITGDTLNCRAALLGKEETIIQKKEITNIERCVEELCTDEEMLNDEMELDVKMEIWPELPTITSDTLNCTAAMLVKEETQEISNLPEKGITNIKTCLEGPTLIATATLINADKAIGIERVETRAKHISSEGPNECKYDPLDCKPFAGEKYGKCFSTRKRLLEYMTIHMEEKKHECKVCGRKFPRPSKLKEHLSVHSDEKSFVCDKCGKCFSTRKRLKEHMISHLEVKRHECKVCGKIFPRPCKLKEHLSVHSDEKPPVCDQCGKCFSTRKRLEEHMKGHECNVCGKMFPRPSDLKDHLSDHSDEKPFVCDKCGKCVSTKKRLKEHMICHLEGKSHVKSHECKVCGRTFPELSGLTEHLSVHSDEKPFVCDKCGKCFATRKRLRQHMKGHECKFCGKEFLRSPDLKLHLSLHSDERPVKCEKCGKLFSGSHHLAQHMISHSEVKIHECHLCGTRVKHRHSLIKHLTYYCKGLS